MFKDWEDGLVGNNPETVSTLPRRISPVRALSDFVRGRRSPLPPVEALPSAA